MSYQQMIEIVGILYAFGCFVVGITPERYRSGRWYSALVRAMESVSVLRHSDTAGTLKSPIGSAVDK